MLDKNLLKLFHNPFCLRDPDGRYIQCNEAFAEFANITSPEKIKGMNDTQFTWDKYIDVYLESDRLALKHKNPKIIEPIISQHGEEVNVFTTKTSILHPDNYDIVGCSISILNSPTFNAINEFIKKNADIKVNTLIVDNYSSFTKKKLTSTENKIYFYILRGLTSKLIAGKLNRSPKTIETHIENLKLKLDCKTRTDLIDYAYKNKLINIFPLDLWS